MDPPRNGFSRLDPMQSNQIRFEEMVRQYLDDLNRYALWLCKDPTFARDLVQETFLRAWRSFARLREPKAAKSWLITILRREFARSFEHKVPDLVTLDGLDLPDGDGLRPEGDSEVRLLRQAMLELAPKYREPILLQFGAGFS